MAPQFLSIKNYDTYQRYKDRLPPWIKLHYSILEDSAWMMLSEVQQCRYMKLLLIASRCNNRILNDQTYLQHMLRVRCEVDLTPLIDSGFLVTFGAKNRRHGVKKWHRETETETETDPNLKKDSRDRVSSERNQETEDSVVDVPVERSTLPKSAMIWESYRNAYRGRYGVDPVRNRSVNIGLCQVVDKLGAADAPMVADYYLSHNGQWYVTKMHPVNLLVVDAEKLRTEWATGRQVTTTHARQADGKAARGQVWNELIEEFKQKEPA